MRQTNLKTIIFIALCATAGLVVFNSGAASTVPVAASSRPELNSSVKIAVEPIQPIPNTPVNKRKLRLGKRLFQEKRLDRQEKISCHSCHDLTKGGGDGLRTVKRRFQEVNRKQVNTPTIFYVKFPYQ